MFPFSDFFTAYARASLDNNAGAISKCYAENFIAAGPAGSMCYKNDEKFLAWLENMFQVNRKIGMQDMQLINVTTSPIGEYYTSALVRWGATYLKDLNNLIEFEITYILQHLNNNYKIIMYITHENEEEVLKEKGIIN